MDSRLKLTIESLFKGEGFTKANRAVKDMSKQVKDATGAFGQLGGAIGGLEGPVGKAADGIGKLVGSLSAGPIGIAIASITLIVGAFNSWKEKAEETKRANEELMRKMEEGYKKRIAEAIERARQKQIDFLDSLINKGNRAITTMQKLHQSFKMRETAKANLQSAKRSDEISAIDLETENKVNGIQAIRTDLKGGNGFVKEQEAIIRAEGELKKTLVKNKDAAEKHAKAMSDNALDIGQHKSNIETMTGVLKNMKKKGEDTVEQELEIQLEREKLEAAEIKQKELEEQNNTVFKQQQIAEMKANRAVNEAKKGLEKSIKNVEDANNKEAEAQRKKADAEAKANKKKELTEKRDELKKFGNGFIDAMKDGYEAFQKKEKKGMDADKKYHNGLFGEYKYKLDDNGNIKNFKDFERSQRYAEREEREERNDPSQKKFNRLMNEARKGKKISDKDKKFMKDYKDFKDAKKTPETIEEITKAMSKKIESIEKQIKDLGVN